ncbi:MAG: hypothetical protein K0B02_02440 [DPANN group archaeon]|nr:hypothetical protein [DPANN group archaeon]
MADDADKIKKDESAADSKETNTDERESDILTSDDFNKIEIDFGKKEGLMDKIFGKKKEDTSDKVEEELSVPKDDLYSKVFILSKSLDDMTLKVEKLEGKLEAEVGTRDALNERISMLTEEIGELRSMILDREKTFNSIQMGYEKISDMARSFDPQRIEKLFNEKEKMIIDNTVKIEKVSIFVDTIKTELKAYREQMSKIRSFENLADVYGKIRDQVKKLEEDKQYTGRMAAKVEGLYSDISDRISRLIESQEKIDNIDGIVNDLTSEIDSLDTKSKSLVTKDDYTKGTALLKSSVDNIMLKLSEMTLNLVDIEKKQKSVEDISDKYNEVEHSIEDIGKALLEVEKQHHIHVEKTAPKFAISTNQVMPKDIPVVPLIPSLDQVETDIYGMLTQANNALAERNTILAKTLYLRVIDIYKQLQNDKNPRVHVIYSSIKALYENIQSSDNIIQSSSETPLPSDAESKKVEESEGETQEVTDGSESVPVVDNDADKAKIDSLMSDFDKAVDAKDIGKTQSLYQDILNEYAELKKKSYPKIDEVYDLVRANYYKLKELHGTGIEPSKDSVENSK